MLDFFEQHVAPGKCIGVESQLRQHLDRTGKIVQRQNYRQSMTSWDLLYNLLRAKFDGGGSTSAAMNSQAPGEGEAIYQYGAKVTSLNETVEGMEVGYTDSEGSITTKSADLIITADGAGSKMRDILTPDVTRKYAGYVAFRGTVPEASAPQICKDLFIDKFTFYTAPGTQILT